MSRDYTITLPAFAGPLDLLLQLIEQAKLDITKIALAHIADQYLSYVRSMELPDPQGLAEFVAMAARLLLIKSRALLPRPVVVTAGGAAAPEDDAEQLARQLREYQRFKQMAGLLRQWQDDDHRTFLRTAPPAVTNGHQPALNHTLAELIGAVRRRMQLRLPLDDPAALPLAPRLTVQQVAETIRQRLASHAWVSFEDLLSMATTRLEVIVTFWAVLEMLKRRAIVVEQAGLFGRISIGRGEYLETTETID